MGYGVVTRYTTDSTGCYDLDTFDRSEVFMLGFLVESRDGFVVSVIT